MSDLATTELANIANARYASVMPGFGQAADAPVMTTPMVPAAVVMTIQGSTLCLIC